MARKAQTTEAYPEGTGGRNESGAAELAKVPGELISLTLSPVTLVAGGIAGLGGHQAEEQFGQVVTGASHALDTHPLQAGEVLLGAAGVAVGVVPAAGLVAAGLAQLGAAAAQQVQQEAPKPATSQATVTKAAAATLKRGWWARLKGWWTSRRRQR